MSLRLAAILCGAARALARPAHAQSRGVALSATLCRRRWKTRSEPDCSCWEPPTFPLCKRRNCMDKNISRVNRCPKKPFCKEDNCKYANPQKYAHDQRERLAIEEQQMWQAREERRLRKKIALCNKYCPKKKKRSHTKKNRCPKDYSEPRDC